MARVYLPVGRGAVPVSGPWQTVTPNGETDIWLTRMAQQQPGKDETARPAVTSRTLGTGSIVAIHGPLFRDYRLGHYPPLRDLIRDLIARLEVPWLVTLDAPRLELILRHQGDRLLINLLNRGAGEALSPSRVVVAELPPVEHVTIRLRRPAPPRGITAIPFDRPLDWTHPAGVVTVNVPRVDILTVVVVV